MQEQDDVKAAILDTVELFLDTSEASEVDGFDGVERLNERPREASFETVHDGMTAYFNVAGRWYKVTAMAEV